MWKKIMNLFLDIEKMVTSLLLNKNHHNEHGHDHHNHHHHHHGGHSHAEGMELEVRDIKITIYGDTKMALVLKDSEQVTLHARALDGAGVEVASADLAWSTSDSSVVTLTVADDKRSAVAVTTGAVGAATVTVTSGSITATFDLTVVAGEVASIEITADAPVSRMAAPAPAPVVEAPAAPAADAPATDAPAADTAAQ